MRVLISAFSNLVTDQRIEKICATLLAAGYQVELVGNDWQNKTRVQRDYPVKIIRIKSSSLKFGYPEFNLKLFRHLAKNISPKTILYCNDLDALAANYAISRRYNLPLVYDSHEIYTEMPSLQGRFTQKIWRFLEKSIVPNLKYFITASDGYADWFVQWYGIRRPVVIRNFPRRHFHFMPERATPQKRIIYQGALNPSRGLEQLVSAMRFLPNAELEIYGDGPLKSQLEQHISNENVIEKVKLMGRRLPADLRESSRLADVGVSLEQNNGLSYYYSLPNKISDYIQAGVPVVVSDFPEMSRLVRAFQVGEIWQPATVENLAETLQKVLDKGKSAYQHNLESAAQKLCWEREETALLDLMKKVVEENFRQNYS